VTGWTFEHIDSNVTLPQITALFDYWRQSPPVHKLAAMYLKYEPPAKADKSTQLTDASEFGVPVGSVSSAEFNEHLAELGINE
jgi:hypothetical protein